MERIDKIRAIIVQVQVLKMIPVQYISIDQFSSFIEKKIKEVDEIVKEIFIDGNYIEVALLEKTLKEYMDILHNN
jgi:hypothetical protein